MLTTKTCGSLIKGLLQDSFNMKTGDKMADKKEAKKYINCSEHPYIAEGKAVEPGGIFEAKGFFLQQLLGEGRAIEATDENVKAVKARLVTPAKSGK